MNIAMSGAMPPPPQGGMQGGQPLDDAQKQSINDILQQYDAESLTQSQAVEIVEQFQELGVKPGRELASVMDEAGFNARDVGELAGVQGPGGGNRPPPPPPPPPLGGGNQGLLGSTDATEELETLLTQLQSEDSSEDVQEQARQSILAMFEQSGQTSLISVQV